MKSIVFAGPSIHGVCSKDLEGIDLRPPAARGDVLQAAVEKEVSTIGLIDGIFEHEAAVQHKEILFALSRGIKVLGSSSMGALRASECHHYGMVGIGEIFEQYKNGSRVADADVALLHGPAEVGFMPLTVALVDAELAARNLFESNVISNIEFSKLIDASSLLGFASRSWSKVVSASGLVPPRANIILEALLTSNVSQKRVDAMQLIAAIRTLTRKRGVPNQSSMFSFSKTLYFASLISQKAGGAARK